MTVEWDLFNPLVKSKNMRVAILVQIYKAPSQGQFITLLLYQQKFELANTLELKSIFITYNSTA